jgi:hypothetical protein
MDSFVNAPCAPEVVTKGPAAALAQLSTVAGEPWVVDFRPAPAPTSFGVVVGSKTCNTKSYFASSITSGASLAQAATCFVLAEDFKSGGRHPPPPPPPPPPSPPPRICPLNGTYVIAVRDGRWGCHSGTWEQLAWHGGKNATNCAADAVRLRESGLLYFFGKPGLYWNISTDGVSSTTIVNADRRCRTPSRLAARTAPADRTVGFGGDATEWVLRPTYNDDDCTSFNILNVGRRGSPRFLSAYETCAEAKVFMASRDKYTGRQQWYVSKLE